MTSSALRANAPSFLVKIGPVVRKKGSRKPRKSFEQRYIEKVALAGANECWHWTGAADTCSIGYGRIWRNGRNEYAHRMAYELAFGPIPAGMQILHSCDCPSCQNPKHLMLGTQADNNADMHAKKRSRKSLTKAEVIEIDRLDREDGTSHARLARKFKVSETSIRRLLSGATWGHVTGRMTAPARARAAFIARTTSPSVHTATAA